MPRFMRTLRVLLGRRRFEDRMSEELASHLAHYADDLEKAGIPRDEAVRRARMEFGSVDNVRADCRQARHVRWADDVAYDLRYAARLLARSPGLAVVTILTLAAAFGANQAIVRAVETMLSRPLPYRDAGRLAVLWKAPPQSSSVRQLVRIPEFDAWRRANRTFEDLAFATPSGNAFMQVIGEAAAPAEEIAVSWVSANFTTVLGADPSIGRSFAPGEAGVLLSHAFWLRRFGGSPSVLGSRVKIAGTQHEVVGVMPRTAAFPDGGIDVWGLSESLPQWRDIQAGRGPGYALVVGRLKVADSTNGAIRQAQDDLRALSDRTVPAPDGEPTAATVATLREYVFGASSRSTIFLLWVAVSAVLLIGCVNVTGLLLARNASRSHEMATRRALGAGQGRLVRQVMAEAVLLAVCGGLASIPVSIWAVRLLFGALDGFPDDSLASGSMPALAFACVIVVVAGVGIGLGPAVHLLRQRPRGLNVRADHSGSHGQSLQSALVVSQVALTMTLLVATGVLVRSYLAVERVDLGFSRQNVLTLFAGSGDLGLDFYPRAIERLRTVPGVEYVGASNTLMFLPAGGSSSLKQVDGKPAEPADRWRPLWSIRVGGDYFQALGIPLIEGRWFSHTDGPRAPPVAIVNETMARRFWPSESPLGKRFKDSTPQGANDDWITVVGLVKDTRNFGLERDPVAQWFQPQRQSGRATTVMVIRTHLAPESVVPDVRAALHDLDKEVRIARISTLDQQLLRQTSPRRVRTSIMIGFSLFALLLSMLGIYGLLQYAVSRRTSEIGVRVALGATRGAIARLVVGQALRLAVVGVILGFLAAAVAVRLMASQLFGVEPMDAPTLIGVPILLCAVAIAASVLPLRRATSVTAVVALRGQ
jgi:putative ABC transport system permease protein